MRTFRTCAAAAAPATALVLALAGCGGGSENPTVAQSGGASSAPSALCPSGQGSGKVTIGSFNFGESDILAYMYADALKACGYDASVKALGNGNREVIEPALEHGQLDLVPEYVGTLTEFINKKDNGPNAKQLASGDLAATKKALDGLLAKRGLVALTPAQAADQNAFAVTQAFAQKNNLTTLSDLGTYSQQHPLTLGGPPECPTRPFCEPGLKQVYSMKFKGFKSLDAGGPLTKKAIQDGTVDVGLVFSSDGGLNSLKLKVLDDDKHLQTVDNIVPVLRKQVASATLAAILDKVDSTLTTDKLVQLNQQVDVQRKKASDVAADYLKQEGLTS